MEKRLNFRTNNPDSRVSHNPYSFQDGGGDNQLPPGSGGFGSSLSSLDKSFYGINSEQTIKQTKADIRNILQNPSVQNRVYRVLESHPIYLRIEDIINSIIGERKKINFKSVASDDNKVDSIFTMLQNESAENDEKIRKILTESLHNSTISQVTAFSDDIQEENSNTNQSATFEEINLTHEIIQQQQIYADIQNREENNLYSQEENYRIDKSTGKAKDKPLPPVPFDTDNKFIQSINATDGKFQVDWINIPRRDVKRTLLEKVVNAIKWKGDCAKRAGDRINESNEIAKDIMNVLNNRDSPPFPTDAQAQCERFLNRGGTSRF